ncbi:hypothetical protein J8L13_15240 [Bacteroides fragilis]|uniref:hypothetical protein n=1 Tax=Bacteroides fragilis TaxID=817 RepID=UPI00202E4066|nr:hypothetical protein [Bacteroides fragilis]MCM0238743.1 hypothetical protein [Bacteroides fragilis]
MIRNIFLLMLSALCAWSCTDNLPGDEAPTDGRHSLNITVGPKPAFTDGTLTRADGTTLPETRAVQTDKGPKWEEGDVVWLYATFQDAVGNIGTFYSALKYTDTTWCYLTKAEAGEMGLNNDNSFNRTLILPDGYTVIDVLGYYAGNGKPDKNGLITIPAPSSDTSVPVMRASGERSIQGDSWSFSFTYCCSRLRIPAGYRVQMANYRYYASYDLPGGDLNIKTAATPLDLPAADAPRDIFLLPVADDQGIPVPITLTRSGATWTFTPQPGTTTSATDYSGQSYTLPDLAPGGVTPGGM